VEARRRAPSVSDRSALHDVFFQIDGATPGKARPSPEINNDNVILDDTASGLFVEHYKKYQVIWKGENGRTIMFQNEMPYDPPNQAAWPHNNTLAFAAFKVADEVQHFEGWGLGSYCFFRVDPTIHAAHAFEGALHPWASLFQVHSGVKLHDILTVSPGSVGVIDHVVNKYGAAAGGPGNSAINVVSSPPGP
jgi:hypothetical protein